MDFGFDLVFPRESLRAALIVSLLSVWVLVALFYYLNRFTRRNYFTTWTAAWLFYALWLTLSITTISFVGSPVLSMLKQWCVGISAIFVLLGSLQFMNKPARQTLTTLFLVFLLVWSFAAPRLLDTEVMAQTPVFLLMGLASMLAAAAFYQLRRSQPYVGAGLLSFGFLLWGFYLATYPVSQLNDSLISGSFLVSAVLQLFIAVSMIVLVLEEVRQSSELVIKQIDSMKSEKDALQARILSTEEQCRLLFNQARLHTDLQQAYNELRQTQYTVVQQERLRALGQMASGIAHDVNNALSPIVAFTELVLATEPDLKPVSTKNLKLALTAAEDIALIVARMREFYRRRHEQEDLKAVQLNQVVEMVVEMTRPRWRDIPQHRGIVIEVQMHLATDIPALGSDESELREALTNLILNSVDAMPRGGVIQVSTRYVESKHPTSHGLKGAFVVLEVTDNGVGMDEPTRRRCLEPFFSTKSQRGGSGLGLAMVYGMMERHEGTIEVESEPCKGTTMRLIFPVRALSVSDQAAPAAPVQPRQGLRLLCIDDEPLLRELLKQGLELAKHSVEVADGGESGLELFRAAHKAGRDFDLVITDLGMPHVDGRQVATSIKAEAPHVPVVMLTGWGTIMPTDGGGRVPVDCVMSKPPRMKELVDTIARLASQRANN
jgi:signal transduction histidine kinase/ActR/RegA family two-component response regulator